MRCRKVVDCKNTRICAISAVGNAKTGEKFVGSQRKEGSKEKQEAQFLKGTYH